jgi:hypothetical protein
MTTPVSPRSSGLPSPTRQQLDELDALLQRMLALPVAPSAEADQPVDPPPATETSPPVLISSPAGEEFGVRTLALIHLRSAGPETPPQAIVPSPSRDETALVPTVPAPAPEQPVAEEPVPVSPAPERRPLPWGLRPVVWVNRGFDFCAGCLGAPGRWLRRPWGRTLLGLVGLLLLAGAVGWIVLDWMGWPWWPAALKW